MVLPKGVTEGCYRRVLPKGVGGCLAQQDQQDKIEGSGLVRERPTRVGVVSIVLERFRTPRRIYILDERPASTVLPCTTRPVTSSMSASTCSRMHSEGDGRRSHPEHLPIYDRFET